jgi:hypothetical protein
MAELLGGNRAGSRKPAIAGAGRPTHRYQQNTKAARHSQTQSHSEDRSSGAPEAATDRDRSPSARHGTISGDGLVLEGPIVGGTPGFLDERVGCGLAAPTPVGHSGRATHVRTSPQVALKVKLVSVFAHGFKGVTLIVGASS